MEPVSAHHATSDGGGEQGKPGTVPLVLGGVVGLGALGFWLIHTLAPGELIRPVNPDLFGVAVFAGVLCGLFLAARVVTARVSSAGRRTGNRADAIGGALILPLLISTACLRVSVQAVAFFGTSPQATPTAFTIDGFRVSHGSHYLRVRLDEAGRTFSLHVGSALYSSARRGDSITLPVETGRFGIQRAMVAADPTDADLHHNL